MSTTMEKASYLTRYTDLPSLLHILQTGNLTLLSPTLWDDKNDSYFMQKYVEKSNIDSVLALCFTQKNETYHHWKVFSSGNSGIAIRFNKEKLLQNFDHPNVVHDPVDYYYMDNLPTEPFTTEKLAFSKRKVFVDEDEYRIIYRGDVPGLMHKDFAIDLASITEIRLSPWMHKSVAVSVKAIINSINSNLKFDCNHSQLVDYGRWKKLAD